MVDTLQCSCDGRAIAGAGNQVRRCFRTSLARSTRCAAQVVASTPSASIRSSAACSLSRRSRAQTIHASGLNHQTQRNASAAICTSQSPRRTCASSCNNTTRLRSADHSDAAAGRKTTGRHQPHVATNPGRGPKTSSTPRFRPYDRARSLHSRCHHPSATRRDDARSRRSLANPTSRTPTFGDGAHQPDHHDPPSDGVIDHCGRNHWSRRPGSGFSWLPPRRGSRHPGICRFGERRVGAQAERVEHGPDAPGERPDRRYLHQRKGRQDVDRGRPACRHDADRQ